MAAIRSVRALAGAWALAGTRVLAGLLVLAVGFGMACGPARADDARKSAPETRRSASEARKSPPVEDPDPGFLEFLGSVDGLADINPEYLSQPDPPTARNPVPRPLPPPPAYPPHPPVPSAAGARNNER